MAGNACINAGYAALDLAAGVQNAVAQVVRQARPVHCGAQNVDRRFHVLLVLLLGHRWVRLFGY